MIFQSFILGNLVSLCMKIINSVVVVGLYYGFLTTFSIGPSYLFLLRARVMEEGTEKKVSATIGFITGQLMMFISIYYVPLHLALGRPHTITVLALPCLLFHFFWNNHKHFHFFEYRSTNRNSMRNLSIQWVFLNNLIFQLFNHFILPSSMLVRLVNIYMFRCNNKMLFVTSSFVGWLIGHILFMKWVGLVLVWIQQNNYIRSNKYIRSKLSNFMARIFSILLFITCVYYLGRIPSPSLTKKLKETSERGEGEEEADVEIETTSETKGTKQEQEGSTEEDPSPSLFSEEKEDPDKIDEREEIRVNGKEKDELKFKETRYKNRPVYETYYLNVDRNQKNSKLDIFKAKKHLRHFQKPLTIILFNYKNWNRPFRFIKTNRFENSITLKNEMSQYFFHTCQSAGKERISFTHPPSLSNFFEMIDRKMSLFTIYKLSSNENELYNHWSYKNKEKRKNLTNKLINIVPTIDKILRSNSLILDGLKNRNRLCNTKTETEKKKYLPKVYDPVLKGAARGQMLKLFWPSIKKKIYIQNYIERGWINKIYGVFVIINYLEFQQKTKFFERIHKKSLEKQISFLLSLMNEVTLKPTFDFKKFYLLTESKQVRINSEGRKKNFPVENVQTDTNNKKIRKHFIEEIEKKVPRWSYKLMDQLEQAESKNEEFLGKQPPVRSRKSKRVVIFTKDPKDSKTSSNPQNLNNDETNDADEITDISVIRYSQKPDFKRAIIRGSIRAQRRKTIICKVFEGNIHSPTFLDRIENDPSFSFYILDLFKKEFKNWLWKNTEFKILDYTDKKPKESNQKKSEKRREKKRIAIYEAWDSFVIAQIIRGLLLVTQSILRKYIILPSLIIVKNITRILLFQFPEWYEDLTDWGKEMHVKCTYNGVQLSETEFPKNWLRDGIQIKILFPFRLKPWHKSKLGKRYTYRLKNKEQTNDFFFLTVLGKESELPCGSPQKQLSFFEPIFKELQKKIKKVKKKCFWVLIILKERITFFINALKKKKKKLIKNILVIKKKITKLIIFGFKEIDELSKKTKEQNFIHELSSNIQSPNCTTCALTKQKIQGLAARTSTIVNELQKISKDNKNEFISLDINKKISSNKMSYDNKRLESPKTILQLLKKTNIRLTHKTNFFINFFFERIHRNIFLYINNIYRINVQPFFCFFKKTKKRFNKYGSYIYKNETNQEKITKTNKNRTQFLYTIKKTKSLSNIRNKKLHSFCDFSYLSQAYVFYKLSQNTVLNFFNLYKLRLISVFQSNVKYLFLKNEIKNYFIGIQKILHSELTHKNLRNFRTIHQCKNGLNDYYQNYFSQFILPKSRNRINHHFIVIGKKNHLNKYDSYKKNRLINFEKHKNVKKQNRYDLLSYNFIKPEDNKNSTISGFSLQINQNRNISFNYDESKRQSFNILGDILIKNYLIEVNIIHIKKNLKRKFFHWIFIHFCFRKKKDKKKIRFFTTIQKNQGISPSNKNKKLFDWMRMNEELKNCSTKKKLFFPEFWMLSNSYKMKPWTIPIKLLLLNFNGNGNENACENKTTAVKKKRSIFLSIFSLEKQREKECTVQTDFESTLLNYEKYIEENYMKSKMKKDKIKKKYTDDIDKNFFFVLNRYLLFQFKYNQVLNKKLINNVNVYCLLLRLLNPKEITLTSIQRGEMSLDILKIDKNLIFKNTKSLKKKIFILEPVPLSIKRTGQFIMYQTMGISVVHNSNHTINQRSGEKGRVDKKNFDELIPKLQKITENRDKTYYDLFVPENILSPRHRREFRILICFYSINRNVMLLNAPENRVVLNKKKRETNTLIKLKFFLWPNYRLEDFACMNRYWFDTNNGSRFGLLRIHMYPQFEK
uniref:hypothetical protein RF1 n=1 Tax=Laportea medogensis TaxID=2952668 RepID=UPI00211594C3|nr:hypothetical protein RF1 [Laportea medogensis]USG97005.1 hypothetical protein RF1 [Laportea medogensis]